MKRRQKSSCHSLRKNPNRSCADCRVVKALIYSAYCRGCATKRQIVYMKRKGPALRHAYRKRVRDFVKEVKNTPCADCKCSFPWYVMDFDHRRGKKHFNLSVATSQWRSMKRIKTEIKKCDIVCANCHRIRTFTQRGLC